MKYNLVFINLTWLLGVQMDNIISRDWISLKRLNIVFLVLIQNGVHVKMRSFLL